MGRVRPEQLLRRRAAAPIRRIGLAWLPILLLLAAPAADAQDAHPNDEKVVFFKMPDRATFKLIKDAVTDGFNAEIVSERSKGRAVCYRYPLWSAPFLVKLLTQEKKSTPSQRRNAVLTLARLLDPEGRQVIRTVAETGDENAQVQAFACLSLGYQPGPESTAILVRALRAQSQDVRVAAAHALARLGGSEAEAALLRAWKEEKADRVRRALIVALGRFVSPGAAAATAAALTDRTTDLRWRAVLARANAGLGPAEERRAELTGIYESRMETGKVRALALFALARFTGWRGLSRILVEALDDRDGEVVEAAARALQHRGDPQTRDAILRQLRKSEDDTCLAARLLVALADIEAVSPSREGRMFLVDRLRSRDHAIRIYTAVALTRVGRWDGFEDLFRKAVKMLLSTGSRGDEERASFGFALKILSPEDAPPNAPDAWHSPRSGKDEVLESLDESLHEAFLALTNWFLAEEMLIHSIIDRPISRRDLGAGTERVMSDDKQELRDLREWLDEMPYYTAAELPDRGYRD